MEIIHKSNHNYLSTGQQKNNEWNRFRVVRNQTRGTKTPTSKQNADN